MHKDDVHFYDSKTELHGKLVYQIYNNSLESNMEYFDSNPDDRMAYMLYNLFSTTYLVEVSSGKLYVGIGSNHMHAELID